MGNTDGVGRIAQPVEIRGRSMAVLYGSETGTAEDIAGELGKSAERLHFRTTVDEMDSFKLVGPFLCFEPSLLYHWMQSHQGTL